MDKLTTSEQMAYRALLDKLQVQLQDLSLRCTKLDQSVKQTENQCFVFEVHLFPKRCLRLSGYIEQIKQTYHSVTNAIEKQLPEALIEHECERFVEQFQVLLKLIQGLEKGDAKLLYKSYSSLKEQIFQQLSNKAYIKEKIAALKVRYQKCNTFTQKLEFQLEEIQDD